MSTDTEDRDAARKRYEATINDTVLSFTDPVPDTRQILNAADFRPADDCILIQILSHGSRALDLDETVDLREAGMKIFWAFRSDRIFRFTVDERGFEWGASIIKEPVLRNIAQVKEDEVLVLEREGHPDKALGPEDEVNFAKPGTEHLCTKKRLVTVFFGADDKPVELEPRIYTTEELMGIFPMTPGYLLNLLEGELIVTLKPHQKVHIKEGMHFYEQPPGGGSS